MTVFPHASEFGSLVEILDDAARRWPSDRVMYGLMFDSGMTTSWSVQEMRRRSMLVAWRLRAAGLEVGDRLMTWAPSSPHLAAVYWGAMRAGIVIVPIDLRMTKEVIERIASVADTCCMAIDEGHDAPDPAAIGLDGLQLMKLADLSADAEDDRPDDWEAQLDGWAKPDRDTLFQIHFTSGTTAAPKGVLLTHGNFLASMGMFDTLFEHRHMRTISLLPLSHMLEQIGTLFYGTMLGAEVVHMRSRNLRVVLGTMRDLRVNVLVVIPQLLEVFWAGLLRELKKRRMGWYVDWGRRLARHLPYRARRALFWPLHRQLGGALELVVCSGAYLPPELQIAWEDIGVVVMQGYGSTEVGFAVANDEWKHPPGKVGRRHADTEVRIDPASGEILVRGPNVSSGYWRDEESTRASRTEDGWFRIGDTGRFTDDGDLVLSGRLKNMIVLPNGLNVFPEDIEGALANHGLSQSVVLETEPGRIEAVVRPPGSVPTAGGDQQAADEDELDDQMRAEIDAIVKAANSELSMHQRIAAWRLWPERDFPRTHTMKVRRNPVREWAGGAAALQVREAEEDDGS